MFQKIPVTIDVGPTLVIPIQCPVRLEGQSQGLAIKRSLATSDIAVIKSYSDVDSTVIVASIAKTDVVALHLVLSLSIARINSFASTLPNLLVNALNGTRSRLRRIGAAAPFKVPFLESCRDCLVRIQDRDS